MQPMLAIFPLIPALIIGALTGTGLICAAAASKKRPQSDSEDDYRSPDDDTGGQYGSGIGGSKNSSEGGSGE